MASPAVVPLQTIPRPSLPEERPAPRAGALLRHLGRRGSRGTVVAVLCALLAIPAAVGAWALSAPAGARGHDVSYPQCGTTPPSTGTFGVIGVNGGRVSTPNPCLASQYAWATGRRDGAALYVNTGNPGAISTFYWPASGSSDPALCTDRSSAADTGCAYDYGWHGAADSLRIATNALGASVTDRSWWLDVEVANSWNGTTAANAASLQGAVDRLRSAGIGTVGIYSTSYQWGQITGGYRAATAASYRSAWTGAFTPRVPLESAPLWIAGLGTADAATTNCSSSFTGARTMLAQYSDGATDGDVMCGGTSSPPATDPTGSPTSTPPSSSPSSPTSTSSSPTSGTTTSTPTSSSASSTAAPTPTTSSPVVPPVSTTTSAPTPTNTTPTSPTPTSTTPTTTLTSPTTTVTSPPSTTTPTPAPTTAPPAYPGPPTAVTARTAPDRGIVLSWNAPLATGGSPITRYYVLRGAAPGRETTLGVLTCAAPTCRWQDTSITRGRAAYYQVVAVNAANVAGYRSVEVAARGR